MIPPLSEWDRCDACKCYRFEEGIKEIILRHECSDGSTITVRQRYCQDRKHCETTATIMAGHMMEQFKLLKGAEGAR